MTSDEIARLYEEMREIAREEARAEVERMFTRIAPLLTADAGEPWSVTDDRIYEALKRHEGG